MDATASSRIEFDFDGREIFQSSSSDVSLVVLEGVGANRELPLIDPLGAIGAESAESIKTLGETDNIPRMAIIVVSPSSMNSAFEWEGTADRFTRFLLE